MTAPAGTGFTSRVPHQPATFDEVIDLVLGRGLTAPALFGPLDPAAGSTPEAALRAARRAYRSLARQVHPDVAPVGRRAQAAAAFTRLTELWEAYLGTAAAVPSAGTARTADARTGLVAVGRDRQAYTVGRPFADCDLATLYRVAAVDQVGDRDDRAGDRAAPDGLVLKIARSADDDDLVAREAAALRRMARLGDPRYAAYLPRLLDTARLREPGLAGPARRVNVLARLDGFVTLAQVRAAYPDGLDPRDAAWMWRRLLVAVGHAHRAGVAHGAVLPPHVLIHPAQHGLVLVDWCYSAIPDPADGAVVGTYRAPAGPAVAPSQRIPALVEAYADWYPAEVTRREAPAAATDLALASRCVSYLLGDPDPARLPAGVPAPIRRFLAGCLLPAPSMRPDDAWRLLGELDDLLERRYGERRFRPFLMPRPAA